MMANLGVYSEVGKLRKVIVHRPDLSLKRLTPSNHDELLFDDVLMGGTCPVGTRPVCGSNARTRCRGILPPGSAWRGAGSK